MRTSDLLTVFQETRVRVPAVTLPVAFWIFTLNSTLLGLLWCTCYFTPQEILGMLNPVIVVTTSFEMSLCPTSTSAYVLLSLLCDKQRHLAEPTVSVIRALRQLFVMRYITGLRFDLGTVPIRLPRLRGTLCASSRWNEIGAQCVLRRRSGQVRRYFSKETNFRGYLSLDQYTLKRRILQPPLLLNSRYIPRESSWGEIS
jgi:hypothetical protein